MTTSNSWVSFRSYLFREYVVKTEVERKEMDEILLNFHRRTQIFYIRSNQMTVQREASDEISTSSTSTDPRKAIRATNEILRNTFTCIPDVTTKIVQWISTILASWDDLTNTTSSRILTKSRIFFVMIATSGHRAQQSKSRQHDNPFLHWSWLSFSAVVTLDHRQAIRVLKKWIIDSPFYEYSKR